MAGIKKELLNLEHQMLQKDAAVASPELKAQDPAGRKESVQKYPSPRKSLGDKETPRIPKEKSLKAEKLRKESAKGRKGLPLASSKAHSSGQETVIRGVVYYKAGHRTEAEGVASSRELAGWGGAAWLPILPILSVGPTAPRASCEGTLKAVEPPQEQHSFGRNEGAWMKDPAASDDRIYVASYYYGNNLLEFRNLENFKQGEKGWGEGRMGVGGRGHRTPGETRGVGCPWTKPRFATWDRSKEPW
ncbi:hypothetical protein Chor_004308 [Crotalus horridus]